MARILVLFYSRSGENHYDGGLKYLEKGNTHIVADLIAKEVGADLFQVDTRKPYSEDYRTCCQEAVGEWKSGSRPEVKAYPDSLDSYDLIFVGYPIWCGTMPMCMYTFLEHYDLSGKKLLPFCTHEGSGLARSVEELAKICPGADIGMPYAVRGCKVEENREELFAWAWENI